MNPLLELTKRGQSVWLDFITRKYVEEGGLARLVEEDGLRGVTSNPTIFQKAIAGDAEYDGAMERLLHDGKDARAIYEALAIGDIQKACDALAPVYAQTRGADGFVSLEVNPHLAADAEGTVREALDLRARVARPNLMIKIPATLECLSAIERVLGEGVSVNVTLIFSLERYGQVLAAWLAGLERAQKAGRDLAKISSVASFFISRVDTLVDGFLKDEKLRGKAAIANAQLAYDLFTKTKAAARFQALLRKGALPQRPLWASTSTKNPAYRDVLYIEELVGRETVNTVPPQTLDAFRDHGRVRAALAGSATAATETMQALERAGVDMVRVTDQLEKEGVKAFVDSYDQLLAAIEKKRQTLLAPR